ncbi:MAG: hypothetical protein IJ031_01230 [Oscillospiraceae bacterium]|nr:hypothetical protein [Oscillospiraceae bacterium]MBQ8378270.1 hypothetical protein [Oscillospiraceae bacterium]MBQ8883206.1 hypothetical protein [Oscillospiraceae bacterium]
MGFDLGDIKEKLDKVEDKIPDEVIEKVKDVATKENLEKVKDKAEDLFDKIKK